MTAPCSSLHVLTEEPSMEPVVTAICDQLTGGVVRTFVHPHGGITDLVAKAPDRLRGYARSIDHSGIRVVVLIDRDAADCVDRKQRLEAIAHDAGLPTKSRPSPSGGFFVVNRVVVRELESWLLGDPTALRAAFPPLAKSRVLDSIGDPDRLAAKPSEKLQRVMRDTSVLKKGQALPKVSVARQVAPHLVLGRNASASFQATVDGITALVAS